MGAGWGGVARVKPNPSAFLPASWQEMQALGWDSVDVVLVSGDAYVDHPAFGVALIGRWLEAHGFRVAILAQPRHDSPEGFRTFGRPRLFFGISAGNLDSIVANYSGNAKVRDKDPYSPQGNPYFGDQRARTARRRPDRATIHYGNLARAAYHDVPIILGGLEASLRRFVHYDYQQAKLRTSVLTDSKADLLVYGMGERATLEIAQRLQRGEHLTGIEGTCERITDREREGRRFSTPPRVLPSWDEIRAQTSLFLDAELEIDQCARHRVPVTLLQRQQAMWVLHNPPAPPLEGAEMDALYTLPFTRTPHRDAGAVPAHEMIRNSVTIVRGCSGSCSFCAIARHQGSQITSRSRESVLAEVKRLAGDPDFRGTISDLGGPTANLYGASCSQAWVCKRQDCLFPKICPQLRADGEDLRRLLRDVAALGGVDHVYIASGMRMELLLRTPKLLARLLAHHIPGALKIAPEHSEDEILRLMHKGEGTLLQRFVDECRKVAARQGARVLFTPYLISAHPGCSVEQMKALAQKLRALHLPVHLLQDFTPTPGTLSTAMHVTGLDRDTRAPIHVPRGARERREQRKLLEEKSAAHRRRRSRRS
jgi:uncharacterized radical SAM protein YgiQ